MAMFKKQVRFTGNHAEIMQKYCKDKGGDQEIPFIISNNAGEQKPFYIFETRVEIYMVAGMLGILQNKQADEDKGKYTATIMTEMLEKQRPNLERVYQHMILSTLSDLSADAKIKKAFSIRQTDDECDKEQQRLENYVRGGLEIIDDLFKDCKTYEDICNSLFKLDDILKFED